MLLKFALNEFRNDREYRNLSPRTITSYLAALEEFHQFCVQNEIVNLEDCTASLVKNYLVHCGKNRKNNSTTVHCKQ
ncbi:site-specific integrase [Paenibacillus sp. J22TS3]|uniref:site-specific integrase n=1 Tax=Paenibacillus sp. J22TS3 TaxID=2807192 RepID=UPI001B0F94C7|nr:hypothetical protein J22TS3_06540 [Paenibacillus sp. J22TS3]